MLLAFVAALGAVVSPSAPGPVPPANPPVTSVLVLDLTPGDVPANTAKLLTELVSDRVSHSGVKTVSASDLRRVAELAADRSAAGCDTSSCLAEIANAMGVDLVVFGDVGKLGDAYIVSLRLFDSRAAESVARENIQATTFEQLRVALPDGVDRLLSQGGIGLAEAAGPDPLLLGGVGVAALGVVVGGGLGVYALVLDGVVAEKTGDPEERADALQTGQLVLAGAAAGATVALVGVGLIAASFVVGAE